MGESTVIQITAINEIMEISPPALNISLLLIIFVENVIAFGGVDMGKAIPTEQAKATETARKI